MNPQEQRLKATAVLMLTVSLFLVRNAHAARNPVGGSALVGTPGHHVIWLGSDRARKNRTYRLVGVERTG